MVSEKKFYKFFFSIISLWELMIPGACPFGPQGLDSQDLCRGPLNNATYYTCKLWASWFQRRRFFLSFSHYKCMGANDPRGMASLGPRGLIGRIYLGDHFTLLHTMFHGFREEECLSSSHISLWKLMTPWVWPV